MEIHEFLDCYGKDLENGIIKEECIGDIFDFLLEMASSDISAVRSQLERLDMHLLKYQYQRNKQSKSWINTIRNASSILFNLLQSKSLRNKIDLEMQEKVYNRAKVRANFETGLPITTFPENIPSEFNLDNLIDVVYIENFLRKYATSSEAKKELEG